MKNASEMKAFIASEKAKGTDLQTITWNAALMCVGWPYVFGASGQECTPAYRRQAYANKGKDHPTIKSACDGFESGNCSGCKWYPNRKRVLCFDCRGFTYDMLYLVYGWKLQGGGCTTQWNNPDNWSAKGAIANGIPQNTLVCLFYSKNNKEVTWEHTGFGLNGETVECSNGVQHFTKMNKKWTHWAVPKCVGGDIPTPTPTPTPPAGKAIVTGRNVALREGPSTSCHVATRIATGTVVDIATFSGWTYVKHGTKYGFMMNQYIDIGNGKVTVTGKNVALREGPSTGTHVLTRIPTGQVVPTAELPTDWEYIRYGNKEGFMMKQYLRKG